VKDVVAARWRGETWLAQRYVRQRAIATPWGPRYVSFGAYCSTADSPATSRGVTPEDARLLSMRFCVPSFVAHGSPRRGMTAHWDV